MRLFRKPIIVSAALLAGAAACRDTVAPASHPTGVPAQRDRAVGKGPGLFPIAVTSQTDNAFVAATDGARYLLATVHYDNTTGISSPGTLLLGPSGEIGPTLTLATNAGGIGGEAGDVPSVGFDGTHYLAVFQAHDSLDIDGEFIDRAGAAAGAPFIIKSTAAQAANGAHVMGVAYAAGTYLVVYQRPTPDDDPDAESGVFARTVSTSGAVGQELALATPALQVSVASDGSRFAVLYVVGLGPNRRAEVRFISPAGVLGDVVQVSATGAAIHRVAVGIAFNGSNYLAVWAYPLVLGQQPIAYAARAIARDGTPASSTAQIPLADDAGRLCTVVAGETGNFLVSYAEGQPSQRSSARFFATDGSPLGGPFTVAAPDAQTAATFSCVWPAHGNRYLNLIMKKGSSPDSFFQLYGSFATYVP